ncbi:hypothetical protein [Streptomyces sp. NPDC086989]|uniref:hypothetical protein n=1 Tax=Streptomyces sp. NPDC086989 TaxID=3365764 RepID=UPI0037F2059D
MNDPTTLAATQDDDPRGLPGTCPPVEEVAELVNLLEGEGRRPNRRHRALRAAAVGRPVRDVALLAGILGTEEDGGPAAPGRTAPPVAPGHSAPPAGTARSAGPTGSTRPAEPAAPARAARGEPPHDEPYDEATTSRTGPRTGTGARATAP